MFPGTTIKLGKGLITVAKLLICAESAVFVWSRGIKFAITKFLTHESVDSFYDHLKMRTGLADFL